MKVKELLRYIEKNQKVILRESRWREIFKGLARELSLRYFGEREIKYIIVDSDIYTRDYLKIEVKKEKENEVSKS